MQKHFCLATKMFIVLSLLYRNFTLGKFPQIIYKPNKFAHLKHYVVCMLSKYKMFTTNIIFISRRTFSCLNCYIFKCSTFFMSSVNDN